MYSYEEESISKFANTKLITVDLEYLCRGFSILKNDRIIFLVAVEELLTTKEAKNV